MNFDSSVCPKTMSKPTIETIKFDQEEVISVDFNLLDAGPVEVEEIQLQVSFDGSAWSDIDSECSIESENCWLNSVKIRNLNEYQKNSCAEIQVRVRSCLLNNKCCERG